MYGGDGDGGGGERRTAERHSHADRTLTRPSLKIGNALRQRRVVGNAMEELSDRGGETAVVVDFSLQLIYCVLQTSYSETFELSDWSAGGEGQVLLVRRD